MQITIRFYEELNDFLPVKKRKKSFSYDVQLNSSVKDTIEGLGVPHTEVDLILVNSKPVDFTYNLHQGDYVSVFPKFESLDISQITKVRKEPLRKIKFILDVHLGQLAKYLRLLGFDTYYTNHLTDSEIIERSISEDRIILTRDFGILKHKKVTHGYYIRSQNSKTQLKEIIQRFDLKNKIKPFSRCSVCNGIINKIDKKEVEQQLLENTRTHFKQFYQCNSCKKNYWKGSHFENMNRLMDEIINQKFLF